MTVFNTGKDEKVVSVERITEEEAARVEAGEGDDGGEE